MIEKRISCEKHSPQASFIKPNAPQAGVSEDGLLCSNLCLQLFGRKYMLKEKPVSAGFIPPPLQPSTL